MVSLELMLFNLLCDVEPPEKLMAHMAAHRPQRCNYPGCGKEFNSKAQLIRHAAQSHRIQMRSGSPRPIMKTRAAFYLQTNEATKISRRICPELYRAKKAGRRPFNPINITAIKSECMFSHVVLYHDASKLLSSFWIGFTRFAADGTPPVLPKFTPVKRGKVNDVSTRLGTPIQPVPEWLIATPKDELPQPERLAFTPPPRGEGISSWWC